MTIMNAGQTSEKVQQNNNEKKKERNKTNQR